MPELPEIHHLAQQMHRAIRGRQIVRVEVRQPKCLNLPLRTFAKLLSGRTVDRVTSRGKWIFVHLAPDATLLLSLGMGGDLLLHKPGAPLPVRYQLKIDFADRSCLTVRFWWFGYAHALPDGKLSIHKMTGTLGLDPLDRYEFTYARFCALLDGRRGSIKSLLMNQRQIAGIGNVYIQDILFKARLHPDRPIPSITEDQRVALYQAITGNLSAAGRLGGLAYEKDLYNHSGGFKDFLVGYREGKPCPQCGTAIQKIRTGSTSSYICPRCQV
jgi:formamidopyrimidine-DNA glycosylase